MKKHLIIFLLFIGLSVQYIYATQQIPDKLIYKGDTLDIHAFIFDRYIQEITLSEKANKEIENAKSISTALWRGLVATYEVRNDSLFLIGVKGENKEVDLSLIFGKTTDIFMHWHSGTSTTYADQVIYDTSFIGGFYKYETDFHFEKGILRKTEKFENAIKPSPYTQNDQLRMNFIKQAINYKKLPILQKDIKVIIRIDPKQISPKGKIMDAKILRGHSKEFDEEAVRVIKSIPQWDIITRRGKPDGVFFTQPILFSKEDQEKQLRAK